MEDYMHNLYFTPQTYTSPQALNTFNARIYKLCQEGSQREPSFPSSTTSLS